MVGAADKNNLPGVLFVSPADESLFKNWTNLGILHSTGTKTGRKKFSFNNLVSKLCFDFCY